MMFSGFKELCDPVVPEVLLVELLDVLLDDPCPPPW
jgi:hypothetical protein